MLHSPLEENLRFTLADTLRDSPVPPGGEQTNAVGAPVGGMTGGGAVGARTRGVPGRKDQLQLISRMSYISRF